MLRLFIASAVAMWLATAAFTSLPPGAPQVATGTTAAATPLPAESVVAEHRYRLAARIRPLLVFWIGRDNVGGARIVWRRGDNGAQ